MSRRSITKCNRDAQKAFSITLNIVLHPNKTQRTLIDSTLKTYIDTINLVVDSIKDLNELPKMSSATIAAELPSCLRGQIVQDVRSIYKKTKKHNTTWPVLKKPVAIWNNQNFHIVNNKIKFPVCINGKCTQIAVNIKIPNNMKSQLNCCKLGSLRISIKNNKYIAQIAITPNLPAVNNTNVVMGVDLGVLCPAVAVISTGKTQFFGNGRERKYKRRYFQRTRKRLQHKKKLKKIKCLSQKEQRWMNDQDHKISRQIVNYAITNNVDLIKLECLGNIRNSTRTSRKNKYIKYRNDTLIDNWSFYRLTQYIVYKARLAGIKILFINPANTSKKCPYCSNLNTTDNRHYECECGYKSHRDRVGAYNIMKSN